jgi:hypothetical protein
MFPEEYSRSYYNEFKITSVYCVCLICEYCIREAYKVDITNRKKKHCGSTLVASSIHDHDTIVQLLLDFRANVHFQRDLYEDNLLWTATEAMHWHRSTVRIFLKHGAELKAHMGSVDGACKVSPREHKNVVKSIMQILSEWR